MKEVLGHGGIARVLEETNKGLFFFASGVANSQEKRESEYDRERQLLLSQDRGKHIVYFSSLCVFTTPGTRYAKHKMEMEDIVRSDFPSYTILRIGNCEWGDNPHQLVPFIKSKLASGEPFEIYDEWRHLVTKDEFLYWVDLIPEDRNCEMSIVGERMKVKDIVERYK